MSTLGRKNHQGDTLKSQKNESFVEKLTGTLTRKKKKPVNENPEENEENEAVEVDTEGREALDSATVPYLAKDIVIDEGETIRFITKETNLNPNMRELVQLLVHWLNEELADQRIVVRHVQEDLYDGQILQKLVEKLGNIRIEVPEVSQSEEGQRQKLQIVIATGNRLLNKGQHDQKWSPDLIHSKDLVAILQFLIALAIHFRAPIRLPEYVEAKMIIATKTQGHVKTQFSTEQLTTTQDELGLKGDRDAFDTLFDFGPDKLAQVKESLITFCNRHLNKINLEVNQMESQFQDGVFLVLLMGLLEGYFVPLHSFHLQVATFEDKVRNISFAFKLMEEAGLPKPKSRVQDIANGDLKSTMRLLHLLFLKYKHL
ncbi:unnamed protein product [Auanema sp. JU1783]|nr:unnamed protein product [Auanema sp. JU1783]